MVQINIPQRELLLKIVYYGPALSGKTTCLQALHAMAPRRNTGRLMALETRDDRTLFFDMLPIAIRTRTGFRVKIKLLTVPGQVIHESTRRVILQGTDAVAFIADSQISEHKANQDSFFDLRKNLKKNQLPKNLPMIIQFNKRDLSQIRSEEDLRRMEQQQGRRLYRSVALTGQGVREALEALLIQTWEHLSRENALIRSFSATPQAFGAEFFKDWSLAKNRARR